MQNFTYHSPTKVLFGRGAEMSAAREIRAFGGTRVLVVYGRGSAVKSGLLGRMEALLKSEGLAYVLLGGVKPNPELALAREGVRLAVEAGVDFILAVGGGSVIDTAKGIALGAANPNVDIWRYWTGELQPAASLPLGVVLTIPAAGSEMSESAVLTDGDTQTKRGLNTPLNRPRFAAMNPELALTLPKYQVACGVVDILMHTLDRYFTPTRGNALTDELAEALLRVTVANGRKALESPGDYDAMSELMWCGSLSHNGLTGLGAEKDFATHMLGHELSGKFDAAHGASLSTMWGAWAAYCMPANPERFARYARNVWGLDRGGAEETARAGIEATVAYFASLGMPTRFTELGIGVQSEEALRDLAERCSRGGTATIGSLRKLGRGDIYEIYSMANR